MDWFGIIFIIAMVIALIPLGVIIATNRADRARAKRKAEYDATWQQIHDREELRRKYREELRVRTGGVTSRNVVPVFNPGGKVRAQIPAPMSSERRRVADRSEPSSIIPAPQDYVFGSYIGCTDTEPSIKSGGGTFDGGGASGDWSNSSSSSSSDSCSSSSDSSSSSSSDSGSCSSSSD